MQEFVNKLIERLKEESWWTEPTFDEDGYHNDDSDEVVWLDRAIEIVNQLAEEYEECYKDCGQCEAYDKEKHHCPKFCKLIKDTVAEIEENQSGWIPCSDKTPSGEFYHLVCTVKGGRTIARYRGLGRWWDLHSHEVEDEVIAWQPLPAPYHPSNDPPLYERKTKDGEYQEYQGGWI